MVPHSSRNFQRGHVFVSGAVQNIFCVFKFGSFSGLADYPVTKAINRLVTLPSPLGFAPFI
jgi:hypothetical protein